MDNPLDVPPGGLVRCADQLHSGCAVASHRIDVLAIDLGLHNLMTTSESNLLEVGFLDNLSRSAELGNQGTASHLPFDQHGGRSYQMIGCGAFRPARLHTIIRIAGCCPA